MLGREIVVFDTIMPSTLRRRATAFGLLPAAGVALLLFGVLLLPWLGERWADDALGAAPARADRLANRAHSVDPLLVEPYWAHALAADGRGNEQLAFAWYVEAVDRQPRNPLTWQAAGEYAWRNGCPYKAYTYLERYTELDQKARPSAGADDYRSALKRVNNAQYRC